MVVACELVRTDVVAVVASLPRAPASAVCISCTAFFPIPGITPPYFSIIEATAVAAAGVSVFVVELVVLVADVVLVPAAPNNIIIHLPQRKWD